MKKAAVLGLFLMMGVLVLVTTSRGKSKNPALPNDQQASVEEEEVPAEDLARTPRLALRRQDQARPAPVQEELPRADDDSNAAVKRKVRSREEYLRDLDNAFRTDQPPNERSAKTTAALVAAFSSPRAEGAHLSHVDCRATRCQFEADFADKGTDRRVLLDIWDLLGSSGMDDVSGLAFFVASREEWPDGRSNAKIHLFPAEHRSRSQLAGR